MKSILLIVAVLLTFTAIGQKKPSEMSEATKAAFKTALGIYLIEQSLGDTIPDSSISSDTIRVLPYMPTTGNIYINSSDKLLYFKVGSYWYAATGVGVRDSILTGTSVLVNNLVASWNMDEGSGVMNDSIGTDDGTVNGAVVREQAGKIGTAYTFAGSGTYIALGTNNTSLSPVKLAVSAWIKTTATANSGIIGNMDGGTGKGWWLDMTSNKLRFQATGVSIGKITKTSTTSVNTGQWVHCAVTVDGAYIRMYINGVQEGSAIAFAADIEYNVNSYSYVGRADGNYLIGSIDAIHFWNTSLLVENIEELFTKESAGNTYPWNQ